MKTLPLIDDIAIDLGTQNTLIYSRRGLIVNAPTIVALEDTHHGRPQVVAVGHAAQLMEGRVGTIYRIVRPVVDGVIQDSEAAALMLKSFLAHNLPRSVFGIRRALISVPYAVTAVERRAFCDAAAATGARSVLLCAEPVAAAIGSAIDVMGCRGKMLVDCGKGIIETLVMASGVTITNASVRLAGRSTEEHLQRHLKSMTGLEISHVAAGDLNIMLSQSSELEPIEVRGRWVANGFPGRVVVSREELHRVVDIALIDIKACILKAFELSPPELVTDICEDGIYLSGGRALTGHLADSLATYLGLKVNVVRAPLAAVATGNAEILFNPKFVSTFAQPA